MSEKLRLGIDLDIQETGDRDAFARNGKNVGILDDQARAATSSLAAMGRQLELPSRLAAQYGDIGEAIRKVREAAAGAGRKVPTGAPDNQSPITEQLRRQQELQERQRQTIEQQVQLRRDETQILRLETQQLDLQRQMESARQALEATAGQQASRRLSVQRETLIAQHQAAAAKQVEVEREIALVKAQQEYRAGLARVAEERARNAQRDKQYHIEESRFLKMEEAERLRHEQNIARIEAQAARAKMTALRSEQQLRRSVNDMADRSVASVRSLVGEVARLTAGVVGFVSVASLARSAILAAFTLTGNGLDVVSDVQAAKYSIASLVSASTEMVDVHGRLLGLQDEYNANLVTAERLYGKIQVASLRTMAETPQLLDAFQQAIGPATRAMNGLFDENRIVKFTQNIAQAAVAAQVPMHQLGQEIRGVLEGDISPDSRLSQLLFSDIPRKKVKATVEEWKRQGVYFEEMERRMASFAIAGEKMANTYAGSLSNLREAWTMALGRAFLTVSDDATSHVQALTNSIVTLDETTGEAKFNETLISGLRAIGSTVVDVVGKFSTFISKIDEIALKWRAFKLITDQNDVAKSNSPFIPDKGGAGADRLMGYDVNLGDIDAVMARLSADDAAAKAAIKRRLIEQGQRLIDYGLAGETVRSNVRNITGAMPPGVQGPGAPIQISQVKQAPSVMIPVKSVVGLDDREFRRQLGEFERDHGDALKRLFAEIQVAAKDGKVTLDEFNGAKERALGTGTMRTSAGGNTLVDKVTAAEKKAQNLRNEMQELARETESFLEQQRRLSEDSSISARIEQLSSGTATQQAFNVIARIYEEERAQIIQLRRELDDFDSDRAEKLARVQQQIAEKFVADGVDPKIAMARALNAPEYQAALDEYKKRRIAVEESIANRSGDVQSGTQLKIADEYRDSWERLYAQRHDIELKLAEETIGSINRIYTAYESTLSAVADLGGDVLASMFRGEAIDDALSGFGRQMQNVLAENVIGFLSDKLSKLQIRAMGGDPMRGDYYDPQSGMMVNGSTGGQFQANTNNKYANAYYGLQGASALYNLYQNGKAGVDPEANALSGATQGAMIGAQIGGVYGAVVGGLIGAVAGYATSGGKAGYTVQVRNGQFSITGKGSNATQSNIDEAVRNINTMIRESGHSALSLLDAFPTAIMQQLQLLSPDKMFDDAVWGLNDVTKGQNFLGKFFSAIDPAFKKLYGRVHATKGQLSGEELKTFIEIELPKMVLEAYLPVVTEGMTAMGVNAARITAVIAEAKSRDPKEAFQFITDYVSAFATMAERIDFLKKSSGDKITAALTEANKTTPERMSDIDADIERLATGFADLPLDLQLRRVQEINSKLDERYAMELQYIAEIAQARETSAKAIEQQVFGIRLGEAPDRTAAVSMLTARRAEVAGKIATANTPADVIALSAEYSTLTQQIYDFARAARDEFKSLIDGFDEFDRTKERDADARLDPVARMQKINGSILDLADGFESMSNEDQLKNGREILSLINEKYQLEKQWLEEIAATQKSITESIAEQIFGIEQSQRTPQQQVDALLGQQRTLLDRLRMAQTASEVNQIVADLQSNASQLLQLQGPEASVRVIEMLNSILAEARERLRALETAITDDPANFEDRIDAVTTTIETKFGSLSTAADQAATDLQNLGTAVTARLDELFAQIVSADTGLVARLQPIFDAFGAEVQDAGDGLDDISRPGGALHRFRDAIEDTIMTLDGAGRFRNNVVGSSSAMSTESARAVTANANQSDGGAIVLQFTPKLDVQIAGDAQPFIGVLRAMWRDDMAEQLRVFGTQQAAQISYYTGGSHL